MFSNIFHFQFIPLLSLQQYQAGNSPAVAKTTDLWTQTLSRDEATRWREDCLAKAYRK